MRAVKIYIYILSFIILATSLADAQVNPPFIVTEADLDPYCVFPLPVIFPNGSVTSNADGSASIAFNSFSGTLDDISDGSTYGRATLTFLEQQAALYNLLNPTSTTISLPEDVTIGDGSSNPTITFDADGGTDGYIEYDATTDLFTLYRGFKTLGANNSTIAKFYTATNNYNSYIRIGDRDEGYGFYFYYYGAGTGNENYLDFFTDGELSTDKQIWRINQDGNLYLYQSLYVNTTDTDGTPAVGKVTIKGTTNDGSTYPLVLRDSDDANVFTVDTNGLATIPQIYLGSSTGVSATAASGVLTLAGIGGTYNENLTLDLDTSTSNWVDIASETGVTRIRLFTDLQLMDDKYQIFGTSGDFSFGWETTGNDNAQFGIDCGSSSGSGYLSFMENTDKGNANRSPSGTTTHPTWRGYSEDETQANDFWETYHDTDNVIFASGNGDINLIPAGGDVNVTGKITYSGGTSTSTYYVDYTDGSDSNTGLSAAQAWKTFDKVEAATFNPGDIILLQRGETWADTLSINEVGTPDKPIIFGAYGTGAKPLIDSADTRASGIVITGDYITIKDINLEEGTYANIELDGAGHVTLENVDSHDAPEGVRFGTSTALKVIGGSYYNNDTGNKVGIWVEQSGNLDVDGATFYESNNAITLWGAGTYSHFYVLNSFFRDIDAQALHFIDEDGDTTGTLNDMLIDGNTFERCSDDDACVLIWNSTPCFVRNNNFVDCDGWGADMYICVNGEFAFNNIANIVGTSAGAGIETNGSTGFKIIGNRFNNCNYGILAFAEPDQSGYDATYSGNTFSNCNINVYDAGGGGTITDGGENVYINEYVHNNTDHRGNGTVIKCTSADNYGAGILVYLGAAGKIYEAQADSSSTMPCLGMLIEGATKDETDKKVLVHGYYRDDTWNWTPGTRLYVDPDSSGVVTSTKPTAPDIIQQVGIAISADEIYIFPSTEEE